MSSPNRERYPNWLVPTDVLTELLQSSRAYVPPEDEITAATRKLLTSLASERWLVVRADLDQLTRDNSIRGILSRQDSAMTEMTRSLWRLWDERRADLPTDALTAMNLKLHTAEVEFQVKAPELAEQLPEAAETAREIPADSPIATAARWIADAIRKIDFSKLGMLGVLFLLFWLVFFHMNMQQLAGATLFYMVASDYFKKSD